MSTIDYKAELHNLMIYCIENRDYLKASESSTDRTAAGVYQDINVKIHEILESENKESLDTLRNCIINASPLEGQMLDVLNKTYKRLISKTPTKL